MCANYTQCIVLDLHILWIILRVVSFPLIQSFDFYCGHKKIWELFFFVINGLHTLYLNWVRATHINTHKTHITSVSFQWYGHGHGQYLLTFYFFLEGSDCKWVNPICPALYLSHSNSNMPSLCVCECIFIIIEIIKIKRMFPLLFYNHHMMMLKMLLISDWCKLKREHSNIIYNTHNLHNTFKRFGCVCASDQSIWAKIILEFSLLLLPQERSGREINPAQYFWLSFHFLSHFFYKRKYFIPIWIE